MPTQIQLNPVKTVEIEPESAVQGGCDAPRSGRPRHRQRQGRGARRWPTRRGSGTAWPTIESGSDWHGFGWGTPQPRRIPHRHPRRHPGGRPRCHLRRLGRCCRHGDTDGCRSQPHRQNVHHWSLQGGARQRRRRRRHRRRHRRRQRCPILKTHDVAAGGPVDHADQASIR